MTARAPSTREGWPKVRLGDVCELRYGKSLPAGRRSGSGYPVYGSNGEVGRHDSALTSGTTVVVGRKGSFGEVRYSAGPCWPIDTTYFIDEGSTEADLRWLFHLLLVLPLKDLNRAAAIPGLNREDAYDLSVVLPPIEDQRRIAALLDAADAVRAKRCQALARLDTLTQAVFIDMFGDPGNDATDRCLLTEVADLQIGYPFKSSTFTSDGSGRRICRGANVLPGRISWKDTERVPDKIAEERSEFRLVAGDVVVGMDRPWISDGFKVAPVSAEDEGCLLVQRVARLRATEEVPPGYIYELLRLPAFTRHCAPTETTIPHISPNDFRSFSIPRPRADRLRAFGGIYAELGRERRRMNASSSRCEDLFASLQQRAFRGEL